MAVRIQIPRKALFVRFIVSSWGKAFLILFVLSITTALAAFTFFYRQYSQRIDQKLLGDGPFANTSMLFAAPHTVNVGDQTTSQEISTELVRGGYSEARSNRMGYFVLRPKEIDIYPGPDSYTAEGAVIHFAGGKVSQVVSLRDNTSRTQYLLEPELISNLFDKNREKRRLVKYSDIPPLLVHAVISAEDKRFFQHSGFDPIRIVKAAYVDIRERRNAQGASTLSQQLARSFWLDQKKTWRRKMAELLITMHLEQTLSKEKIFEYYVNQVDLGRRGSFGIRGFGEASQAYFGKDISRLTLPEAATLAGLIQRPSFTNPFRWPERARQRRNIVLSMMRDNTYITPAEYETAAASPLAVAHQGGLFSTDAPYFVDLVNETLLDQFQDRDFQTTTYRVYTTLDLQLQRDAADAVRIGMEGVDKLLERRHKRDPHYPEAQCALIAIDPQTAEVKAFIGGRNYGVSQLDHLLAKRQPGSVFKPFVYAAALSTALNGGSTPVITPVSILRDEPTTFYFDDKEYTPNNFKGEFHGNVTLRQALAHSMNVAAVALAQEVGYGKVVDLARRAGLNMDIRPTPAVALGAYEVTPIEIAGAYTIYSNQGVFVKPNYLNGIRDGQGQDIFTHKAERQQVLDPRVAFMMDSLMEEVLRTGTGAGIHGYGFNLPAAGKTGTSHDGWFAGFTSKLLCIVWVGFDDNRELNLEGAHSALPVWAEFMKRAHQHREYRNVKEFEPPAGIVGVQIDPATSQLATSTCPTQRTEYFVDGTQPVETCRVHRGGATQVAAWDLPDAARKPEPSKHAKPAQAPSVETAAPAPPPQEAEKKKRGFLDKLKDVFKR